jgi:SAM-dependent methyltransferase
VSKAGRKPPQHAFAFGENWRTFTAQYLSEERTAQAIRSLREFAEGYDFTGKRFLDVGCGSGLFSLAAHRLGVGSVTSFDVDADSVRSCEDLRQREGAPATWEVKQGSVLDGAFLAGLQTYDVVYAWGVLHHTGDMWRAIDNTTRLVSPGGLLWIAIYNRADGFALYPDGRFGPSSLWAIEKRLYNRLPRVIQDAVDYSMMTMVGVLHLCRLKNPFRGIRNYQKFRGMSFRVDIRDWLGGYPYEFATVEEVFDFVKRRGFQLQNLKSTNGLRNNEFLFRRASGESASG